MLDEEELDEEELLRVVKEKVPGVRGVNYSLQDATLTLKMGKIPQKYEDDIDNTTDEFVNYGLAWAINKITTL